MVKYGFWLQSISWARTVRFYQYYPCNKNGSFDDYFDLKRYWRTQSLLLEVQLNLFVDPAYTNFINDPFVVGLEKTWKSQASASSPWVVGIKYVTTYAYVPQAAIISGGLKNWFFILNIREKYFCLLSYLEKLQRNMKNGFFLLREKAPLSQYRKL